AAALAARPAAEPVLVAIRAALEPVARAHDERPERVRALLVMLRESALRATREERRERWRALLVPLIDARLDGAVGAGAGDPRAAALAGAVMACLEAAQEAWLARPQARMADLLDRALAAIAGP